MASNLSTIGFDDSQPEELEKQLLALAQSGTARVATPVGDYAIWRSRTGVEVWFHLAPLESDDQSVEREIVGLTPFFEGTSDVPLNVISSVKRSEDSMMDGAFHAWVAPDEDGEGAYPVVFDAVDFAALSHRTLPERWRARICGFARELSVYADEEAFNASQIADQRISSRSFFPVGLFVASAGEAEKDLKQKPTPSSNALIVGEVVAVEKLVNEETENSFLWMSVKSSSATYDVVVSPELIEDDVEVGSIVSAGCWLFGRALT